MYARAVRLEDERLATVQHEVLIKQLEAVGQRKEHADRDRRHDGGDDDIGQRMPAVGAVDLGRIDQIVRHILQAGNVNDHHVADLLPGHQDDQAPEAVFGAQQDGGAVTDQYTVENH